MTAPIPLDLLRPFALVYRSKSFSTAAETLSVPRSTVSRAIAALEEALGVPLFQRTTRRVTPTAEGNSLFARVEPGLSGLESALSGFSDRSDVPTGTLRVTSTLDLGTVLLAEAIARFTARYPSVTVDVLVSNRIIDLARDEVDLAIRIPRAPMTGSSLVRRKIGRIGFAFYASPAYLARRGVPRTDAELKVHDWVEYRGVLPSQFRALGHDLVPPTPRASCDDMFFLRELVRKGVGIGVLASFLARKDVASGLLAPVPSRQRFGGADVYLVRPARKQVPARVVAFNQVLTELLKEKPLTPD